MSGVAGPLPRWHLPARQRVVALTIPLAWIIAAAACPVRTAPGPGSWYLLAGRQRHQDQSPAGICGMWELPVVALAAPAFAFFAPALCVLLAVPLATPLLRSARHAQLVRDARTDARTGLALRHPTAGQLQVHPNHARLLMITRRSGKARVAHHMERCWSAACDCS